jgi:hypothetical protein
MAFALLPATGYSESGRTKFGVATETMASGTAIRHTTGDKIEKANSEGAATDECDGILITDANVIGQQCLYVGKGDVVAGLSGLTPGTVYYLGGASDEGEVGLAADAATGTHFATLAGVALSASRFLVLGIHTNVQL